MSKKLFFIAAVCIMSIISLGRPQIAQAEEGTQPTIFPFTHVYGRPLFVSANHYLPEVNDVVLLAYSLPVTEEILNEIRQAATQGFTSFIDFQTTGSIEVTGNGSGSYNAKVFVTIEHADGNRTQIESVKAADYKQGGENLATHKVIQSEQSAAASDGTPIYVEKVERYITPLGDWLDSMQAGDTLVVAGMAKGWASSVFESSDSAKVNWRIDGDPNRPIMIGHLVDVGTD